jgi:hypothetical protein
VTQTAAHQYPEGPRQPEPADPAAPPHGPAQPEGVPSWLGELTAPEARLWRAFPHGEAVDYTVGDPDADDPAGPRPWGPQRRIRAAVVAALALGVRSRIPGRTAGVRITGAEIVDGLDLRHGVVTVPLTMRRCRLVDPTRLDEAETRSIDLTGSHTGTIMAEGAHIRGSLKLAGATVAGNREYALHLDEVTIETDLSAEGLRCEGPVCLIGALIGAVLDLRGSTLDNPDAPALSLGGARINRAMLLGDADIRGSVRMPGAQIGGLLLMSGTTITRSDAVAFNGEAVRTAGGAYFQRRFTADGTVVLVGARIGGVLSFREARLSASPGEPALMCNSAEVARSMYLTRGFQARGEIRLSGMKITGHLDLIGIDRGCGHMALYHTTVGTIRDQGLASWPGSLNLDGLQYAAFDPYLPADVRGELLARMPGGYRAQPYEFMASYYRELGHDEEARDILLAKERVRRDTAGRWTKLGGVIFDTLVGYGYRPLRAVAFSLLIQVAATVFFSVDRPTQIDPTQHIAYDPAWYVADLFVPIVHFGQADQFQSHGFAAAVAMVLPYLGWMIGITIVAGASRTLSRGAGAGGAAG